MNLEEEYYIHIQQQNIREKEDNLNLTISYFFSNNKFDSNLNYDMWYNFRRFKKKHNNKTEVENNDGFIENSRKNLKFLFK